VTAGVNPATTDSEATGPSPARRIPSLDGLRAISILAVLFGHLEGTRGFPDALGRVVSPRAFDLANLGVRVFFVISGYLITRILIDAQEAQGSLQLSRFYFNRFFRIVVPYYAFLAIIVMAARFELVQLAPGDLGYALAYASEGWESACATFCASWCGSPTWRSPSSRDAIPSPAFRDASRT
jgi:peptidoglycan/LPS O-acetylase OafA/YrhL